MVGKVQGYQSPTYRLLRQAGHVGNGLERGINEQLHAKAEENEDIIRRDATCGSSPFDKCDFDPRVDERHGGDSYDISTISASFLSVGGEWVGCETCF